MFGWIVHGAAVIPVWRCATGEPDPAKQYPTGPFSPMATYSGWLDDEDGLDGSIEILNFGCGGKNHPATVGSFRASQ